MGSFGVRVSNLCKPRTGYDHQKGQEAEGGKKKKRDTQTLLPRGLEALVIRPAHIP